MQKIDKKMEMMTEWDGDDGKVEQRRRWSETDPKPTKEKANNGSETITKWCDIVETNEFFKLKKELKTTLKFLL